MPWLVRLLAVLGVLVVFPAVASYPIEDRFVATVVGTPKELRVQLPSYVPVKEYSLPGLHPTPKLLWYSKGLMFSASIQDFPAPLVFNIAGTGGAHNSGKTMMLHKALYQAGFHVISLSSPTHMNFMINGSQSGLPGYLPDDAQDLYRVMQLAYGKLRRDMEVTAMHMVGYSLGAANAAFVAELDGRERKLGFERVYMINPPVNLYHSVDILDQLLEDHVPGGAAGMPAFLDRTINRLAAAYDPKRGMRFDGDFLYKAFQTYDSEEREIEGRNVAAALIAVVFRVTSGSMVFTSDLLNHLGYLIPVDEDFSRYEPLLYYSHASHGVKFTEYVDDMMIPELLKRYPQSSREALLRQSSLYQVEEWLRNYPQVRLVTNRDEIIVDASEITYLEQVLGNKMYVYPHGGHCGNMDSQKNIDDMVNFLKGGSHDL